MKKILISMMLISLSSLAFAQDAISKFFSQYEDDEDYTHVTITSRMFGLFANLDAEEEEDKELLEAIANIKGLRILAKDDISKEEASQLYDEAFKLIPTKDYDELMSIKEKDNDMKFLIREKDGVITELVMLMHGDSEFFLLTLTGDIDLKQISRLSHSMAIQGFEHLEMIDSAEHK